jgi:phosphatidylglycerophosphatase A
MHHAVPKDPNTLLMSKSRSDNVPLRSVFRTSGLPGKAAVVLSTWFGAGLLPAAPGTFGTLAALPLIGLMKAQGVPFQVGLLGMVIVLALWSTGRYQDLTGRQDPPEVVIDEVAGFSLTMVLLPASWLSLGLGFLAFRLFDIWKPFPIKRLEILRGSTGTVMDDLAAGLYAAAAVRILLSFPPWGG